jgi:hypothetical protein
MLRGMHLGCWYLIQSRISLVLVVNWLQHSDLVEVLPTIVVLLECLRLYFHILLPLNPMYAL